MGSLGGEWEEVRIVNGYVAEETETAKDGKTFVTKASMQFNPPGRIIADHLTRRVALSELETTKVSGICEKSDESMFESSLKESKS